MQSGKKSCKLEEKETDIASRSSPGRGSGDDGDFYDKKKGDAASSRLKMGEYICRRRYMTDLWESRGQTNPFYTGNAALLASLHAMLKEKRIVAVSGFGGKGKSALCRKYVYSHMQAYKAIIWLDASSSESLEKEMQLMSKVAPELFLTLLTGGKEALLVLDNLQDISLVQQSNVFQQWKGYMLLVTRFYQTDFPALCMPLLPLEESALFILRRGKIISKQGELSEAPENHRTAAIEIAKEMDGFPLALDQAGAYLEEVRCPPTRYLALFRSQPVPVLSRRGGRVPSDSASFVEVIEQTVRSLSSESQQGLHTLASLLPNATEKQYLDQQMLDELLRVFLIERYGEERLRMHRLIQLVIQNHQMLSLLADKHN